MTAQARIEDWVGRRETRHDSIAPDRVAAMAATLDRAAAPLPGEPLPAGWHWMFFNPAARASELGPDGHPRRGGFLPPVALPRRMWAGGRLRFLAPIRVGDAVRRESEIAKVESKSGRSGRLVFVLARHRILGPGGAAIEEEHDIVYREAAVPGAPLPAAEPAPAGAEYGREIAPDPVLLFRYSALTFNGHRIHYDRPYATGVEGYPGLVVHGPLIATLLLELCGTAFAGRTLAGFDFRAVSPLFDQAPFRVEGMLPDRAGGARLWARGPDGRLAMAAQATLAP